MEKSCQSYVNNFIPKDANLLRKIYKENGEQSQNSGSIDIFLPRVKGFLTIPVAAGSAGSYAMQGVFKSGIEVLNGNINEAANALAQDLGSAMKCIAAIVASIAYAALGLVFGSEVYSKFIPQPIPPAIEGKVQAEIDRLTRELQKANDAIPSKDDLLGVQRAQIAELEGKLKKYKTQKTELEQQCEELKAKSDSYRDAFGTHLKQKLESDKALTAQKQALEAEIAKLEKGSENHQKAIADLKTQINMIDEEKKGLLAEYNLNKNTLEILKKDNKDLEQEDKYLSRELTKMTQDYHTALIALEDLRQEVQKLMVGFAKVYKAHQQKEPLSESTLDLANQIVPNHAEGHKLEANGTSRDMPQPQSSAASSNYDVVNWGNWALGNVKEKLGACGVYLNEKIVKPFMEIHRRWFIDGKDPWKEQRYYIALNQIQKALGSQQIEALRQYDEIPGASPHERDVVKNVKLALESLMRPEIDKDVRKQKESFMTSIREALRILQHTPNHGVPKDLEERINALCARWVTSPELVSFNFRVALYVAAQGKPEIVKIVQNQDSSLREMFEGILEGIHDADPSFKAPIADLEFAKLNVLWPSYDNMIGSNSTSRTAAMDYKKGNERWSVQEYRSGVPVTQRINTDGNPKPWELDKIQLSPEFVGFLNYLKTKKEKLLVVLHLDPLLFDTHNEQVGSRLTPHQDKYVEACWIKLFRNMAEHTDYQDVLSVALVPMDGDWLKINIEKCEKGMTLSQLHNYLHQVITQKGSPYIIPHMSNPGQKEKFISLILDQTAQTYFKKFADNKTVLTKEQMLAFVGIFNSRLVEALQIEEKATYVQRNCKDGVDRTGAWVGCQLLERCYRRGLLTKENIKKIIGLACGPALGILKREVLERRQPVLLAVADHLDTLKNDEIVIENPSYEGWQLQDVQMGNLQEQNLYPAPSEAMDDNQYLNFIKHELNFPFATTHKFSMQPKTEVELLKDTKILLQKRYNNEELHYELMQSVNVPDTISIHGHLKTIKRPYTVWHSDTKGGQKVIDLMTEITINTSDAKAAPIFKYSISK